MLWQRHNKLSAPFLRGAPRSKRNETKRLAMNQHSSGVAAKLWRDAGVVGGGGRRRIKRAYRMAEGRRHGVTRRYAPYGHLRIFFTPLFTFSRTSSIVPHRTSYRTFCLLHTSSVQAWSYCGVVAAYQNSELTTYLHRLVYRQAGALRGAVGRHHGRLILARRMTPHARTAIRLVV